MSLYRRPDVTTQIDGALSLQWKCWRLALQTCTRLMNSTAHMELSLAEPVLQHTLSFASTYL